MAMPHWIAVKLIRGCLTARAPSTEYPVPLIIDVPCEHRQQSVERPSVPRPQVRLAPGPLSPFLFPYLSKPEVLTCGGRQSA